MRVLLSKIEFIRYEMFEYEYLLLSCFDRVLGRHNCTAHIGVPTHEIYKQTKRNSMGFLHQS